MGFCLGAIHVFGYEDGWVEHVVALSDGGVQVADDAVGATLLLSLQAVRTRGTLVSYGMAGGIIPPAVDPRVLMASSKALVGGDLWDYLDGYAARIQRATRLFAAVGSGAIKLPDIEIYALSRGADAHRRLENRSFAGKVVLVPD